MTFGVKEKNLTLFEKKNKKSKKIQKKCKKMQNWALHPKMATKI